MSTCTCKGDGMMQVASLSGGKTSSYMAMNYPADVSIFALVRIEDTRCTPSDKSFVQFVSDKIGMDFIATAESDLTLYVVRDLEQIIGREIKWVTSDTFEQVVTKKKALPNIMQRFCTTELKIKPIFDYCHNVIGEIVRMQVGFRYDEAERAERLRTSFKTIVGKRNDGRNKWAEIEWRKGAFPLIDNKITHFDVVRWANGTSLVFPPDSNCVGCFWKPVQQLRRNYEDEPLKMQWFMDLEASNPGNRRKAMKFKQEIRYASIPKVGLQESFNFGTGSGCQAGFCTD